MVYRDKEKKRQYDRKYKESHREKIREWQKEYQRKWHERNRERILECHRLKMRTDTQYCEKERERGRLYHRKTRDIWGSKRESIPSKESYKASISAELFVAQIVLPKYGFTNIIVCQAFSHQFPFDILSKKNGRRVAVEVTISMRKRIDPEKKLLLDFMDADLYVCHVKPDFSQYFLFPVNIEQNANTCCTGVFMEKFRATVKDAET